MKKLFLFLGVSLLSFTSCKKEGCIDADAVNYSAEAKKDNGTCTFEGKIVPWYNQADAQFLIDDGATTIFYYLNGKLVGSQAAAVYFNGPPDCGQNGAVTITQDLGKNKTGSYNLVIKDQTGWVYGDYNVSFTANTCISYYLD